MHVVDEPGDEQERDPGVDPADLLVAGIAPPATAAQIPTVSPAKMPTPPKSGVGTSCQRSLVGHGDEPSVQPRREEKPDRERGSRKGGDRREGAHEFRR